MKCDFLFRVRGYLLIAGDWSLKVGDNVGRHTHEMADELKGHRTIGRLNPNESRYLRELIDSNVPPRKILTNLRDKNGRTSTTIKHIYNACRRYRKSIRDPRTNMQYLLKSLIENKYVYHCRKYLESGDVRDIFWVHPNGVKLFNTFSTVLVLDSTYTTNKYLLLLLEFVGVTSTKLTFSIAIVYMMSEKGDNVTWTIERCCDMLHSKVISPKVVVSDGRIRQVYQIVYQVIK